MKFLLPLTAILIAGTIHLRAQSETTTTTTETQSASGDYSVMKICQSDYTFKTDDGADAGRLEYVVIDPSEGRIVSAVLSGGVLAERFVAVPFTEIRLGSSHQVVLTHITREHLLSAPVIERDRVIHTAQFAPDVVRRTYAHFGVSEQELRAGRGGREDRVTGHEPNAQPGKPDATLHSGNRPDTERQNADRMRSEQQNGREPNATDRENRNSAAAQEQARRDKENSPPNAKPNSKNEPESSAGKHQTPESQAQQRNKQEEQQRSNAEKSRNEATPKSGDKVQDTTPNERSTKKNGSSGDNLPETKREDAQRDSQQGSTAKPQQQQHKPTDESASQKQKAEESSATTKKHQPEDNASRAKEEASSKAKEESSNKESANERRASQEGSRAEQQSKAKRGEESNSSRGEESKSPNKPKRPGDQ